MELYRSSRLAASHQAALWAALASLVLAIGLPTVARATAACTRPSARPSDTRCESLSYGGRDRTYRIFVPARVALPAPMLLVLHGGGGGGGGMEALTAQGFNRRADEVGAIIVYPDGVGRRWNDGRHDEHSKAAADHVDDVGFLRALVASLEHRYPVDRARVFVAGMSNGGMMTLRLACEARDVFKGFVAVAASLGEEMAARCSADGIERLALIDGTADPIVPWDGGTVAVLGGAHGRVIGAKATFAKFMAAANCQADQQDPPLDRVADDGTELTMHRAAACTGGADLRLYEVGGGGHAWPGGLRYAGEWLIGKVSRELDATDEAWRFLGLGQGSPAGPV